MRIECKYDELMPLASIKTRWHPDNENAHSEEQIRSLAKVIAKIGVRHPIHISKRSGKIAGGHGRYLAFQKLGYDEAPIVWENFENELEEINYRASDNIGQYAEFNNHEYVLNLEKAGVDIDAVDLEEFGIIDFELPVEKIEGETDEDEVPEAPEEPVTKRGDVWLLGKHRLMCGDSTMIDDVEKLMNGEKADMVFTDPPYNLVSHVGVSNKTNSKGSKMLSDSEWDKNFEINEVLNNISSVLDSSFFIFVFTTRHLAPEIWEWMDSIADFSDYAIYYKSNPNPMAAKKAKTILNASELCCYCHTKDSKIIHGDGEVFTNVWNFARTNHTEFVGHPTQKPIKLCDYVISHTKGDLVLDLFGGSGSTMISCENLNKKSRLMELDEKYCDVIINRWQNYTGKEATLESTGETYNSLKN